MERTECLREARVNRGKKRQSSQELMIRVSVSLGRLRKAEACELISDGPKSMHQHIMAKTSRFLVYEISTNDW